MMAANRKKLQFFRSCYINRDKYCIGDFVFIRKDSDSLDESCVGRVEAFYNGGVDKKLWVYVTKFLRRGDIPGIKQGECELIMDKRVMTDRDHIVAAADIRYSCLVVYVKNLKANDKTSFYYKLGYDGKKVGELSDQDIQPKFPHQPTENQSPTRTHSNQLVAPSTPAVSVKGGPLADLTLTDNETDSQSDDMEEIFSERLRSSMKRGRTRAHTSSVSSRSPGRRAVKGILKENITDDESFDEGSQLSHCTRIKTRVKESSAEVFSRRGSDRFTKQTPTRSTDHPNKQTSTRTTPGSVTVRSTTRTRTLSVSSAVAPSVSSKEVVGTRSTSVSRRNLIESVDYDGIHVSKSPSKVKDPYHFSSDEAPSPRKIRSINRNAASTSVTNHRPQRLMLDQVKSIESTSKSSTDLSAIDSKKSKNRKSRVTDTREEVQSATRSRASRQVAPHVESGKTSERSTRTRRRLISSNAPPAESEVVDATAAETTHRVTRGSIATSMTVTKDKKKKTGSSRNVSRRAYQLDTDILNSNSDTGPESSEDEDESKAGGTTTRSDRALRIKESHNDKVSRSTPSSSKKRVDAQLIEDNRQLIESKGFRRKNKIVENETEKKSVVDDDCMARSKRRPQRNASNQMKPTENKLEREELKDVGDVEKMKPGELKTTPTNVTDSKQTTPTNVTNSKQTLRRSARKKTIKKGTYINNGVSDTEADSDADPEYSSESEADSVDEGFEPVVKRTRKSAAAAAQTPNRNSSRHQSRMTPGRSHRLGALTPSVRDRRNPLKERGTALERARAQLHVSVVPDSLPCRDEEFANVYSYVESKLENGTGGCLYISGVPGTGKTATVYEVMRYLNHTMTEGAIPDFKFVEINGMRLTQPHQAFVQIYKKLTGKKVTADHATTLLDNMFSKSRRQDRIVLLVDELDLLMTRKQDVLYNIFDWPTKPNSRLIVLAIANTMDLPERVMMNRVSSRLGLNRMTFQPYTFQQLQEIVESRLSGIAAFDPDAIQLASRKVAAVSGDARRALDICRRSTEVAEGAGDDTVSMVHVDKALQEMFTSPKITAIRNCSLYEKVVLKAIVAEFTRSGLEEAMLYQVHRHINPLCGMERMPSLKMVQVNQICSNLNNIKLVLLECNGSGIYQRVRLNVGQDDIQYALLHDEK